MRRPRRPSRIRNANTWVVQRRRVVEEVTDQGKAVAFRLDQGDGGARRVAGCVNEAQPIEEGGGVAFPKRGRIAERKDLGPHRFVGAVDDEVLPILSMNVVPGAREGGRAAVASPADVVDVEMAEDHVGHRLGRAAQLLEMEGSRSQTAGGPPSGTSRGAGPPPRSKTT